jgi:hypothetical protein
MVRNAAGYRASNKPRRWPAMGTTAWAGVLLLLVAVLLASGFIIAWVRDKNRSEAVSEDPERTHTDTVPHDGTAARRERD